MRVWDCRGGRRSDRRCRHRHRPSACRAGGRISGRRCPRWRSGSWELLSGTTLAKYICRCRLKSTSKMIMVVSMELSETYAVPAELALLYDFLNSLDLRRYMESGLAHEGGDEIGTPRMLEEWMRARGLLPRGAHIDARAHRAVLELRAALRDFLLAPP